MVPPVAHKHVLTTREDLTEEGGGERKLFRSEEERQAALASAYKVADVVGRPNGDQPEQIIGVCLLVERGTLCESSFQIALTSTRDARDVRDRFAYWRTCIKNQLAERGADLDELLAEVTGSLIGGQR